MHLFCCPIPCLRSSQCLNLHLSEIVIMSRPQDYEVRPDAQGVTGVSTQPKNVSNIDYEPYPEQSIKLDHTRQHIVDSICRLYSGSASEDDMQVYASESIYDDPWSYCDTRYKIAGQWWGKPHPLIPIAVEHSADDIQVSRNSLPSLRQSRPKLCKTTRRRSSSSYSRNTRPK